MIEIDEKNHHFLERTIDYAGTIFRTYRELIRLSQEGQDNSASYHDFLSQLELLVDGEKELYRRTFSEEELFILTGCLYCGKESSYPSWLELFHDVFFLSGEFDFCRERIFHHLRERYKQEVHLPMLEKGFLESYQLPGNMDGDQDRFLEESKAMVDAVQASLCLEEENLLRAFLTLLSEEEKKPSFTAFQRQFIETKYHLFFAHPKMEEKALAESFQCIHGWSLRPDSRTLFEEEIYETALVRSQRPSYFASTTAISHLFAKTNESFRSPEEAMDAVLYETYLRSALLLAHDDEALLSDIQSHIDKENRRYARQGDIMEHTIGASLLLEAAKCYTKDYKRLIR